MICEKCGAEFDDELQFCPNCDKENDEAEELIIPEEESPAEEVVEEVVEEAIEEELISETEEYSEDELELVEDDEYDEEEDLEVALYDDNKKLPKAFKIIAIIVAAILVLVAAGAVFYGVIRPDIDSPVASWFDDGIDTRPLVYTKKTPEGYGLYIGETQLINFGENFKQYSEYRDFVVGEDYIYYIDNGALHYYKIGAKAPVKIADNVNTESIVMSANGKRILYTSTVEFRTTLYSYIAGKTPSPVTELSCLRNSFFMPNYGFMGETSKFWYIIAEDSTDNGQLYVSSYFGAPKLKYDEIGSVLYASGTYDAFVYLVNKGEKIEIDLRIGNNEPVVMRTDFTGAFEPFVVKSPKEGVVYAGAGNGITDTLFFQPFDGSEAKVIDTGVTNIASVWDLKTSPQIIPYFNYSTIIKKTDAVYVLKGSDLFVSRNTSAPQLFEGVNPAGVVPFFSDDTNTAAYVVDNSKLMLTTYDGTAWSTPVTVAESVSNFRLSNTGNSIAYTVTGADRTHTIYLYDIKTAQTQQVATSSVTNIEFDPTHPDTLIFATDFDAATVTASIYYYTSGKEAYEIATGINGLTAHSGRVVMTQKNPTDEKLLDFYTLDKSFGLSSIGTSVAAYNAY